MSFDPELFGRAMGEAIRRAVEPLHAEIADLKKQLAEMPAPENGKDGEPGRDGKDCDMGQVRAWIDGAVKAIPAPENGKDGRDGKDGKDGADGKDGESFTIEDAEKLLDSKMARWELDFERRANDTLQRAIDRIPTPKDGAPGKDGADGVGFDDLCVEHDGERTVSLVFTKGERVKRFDLTLPLVIDRGIYKPDLAIKAGDGVTWGGSYWIAQQDAPAGKPGEPASEGWRLAVKRGRDGKDGRNGIDKTAPVKLGSGT